MCDFETRFSLNCQTEYEKLHNSHFQGRSGRQKSSCGFKGYTIMNLVGTEAPETFKAALSGFFLTITVSNNVPYKPNFLKMF